MPNNPLITEADVKKVERLARLKLKDEDIRRHTESLVNILGMVAHINDKNTDGITPMSSPFADVQLFLRDDEVTEPNNREVVQAIAPATESGLYLVPKVIE